MRGTYIPSRLKPGNLTISTYVDGSVSMAIQQSSDAGALLRNGSYGSRGRSLPPEPYGGGVADGVRMVGGAGGGIEMAVVKGRGVCSSGSRSEC
jgi:hypothetical protein